ncbi:MAG: MFS transporter [Chloroflexi bacterium]|nr:MFS transporter [Chloroflexota bacterium]
MLKRIGLNRNLAIISVTIFGNVFAKFLWYSLLPLHLRALGANDWEIGISFTLISVAQTVVAIIGGTLADRYGRRNLITLPTFVASPLYLIAALTNSWPVVVAMIIGTNIMSAFQSPAMNAMIMESSESSQVARSFSFSETAVLLALITGPIVGAALIGSFNIPTLILVSAVMLLITGFLRWLGLRESTQHTVGTALPKLRTAIDTNVRWFIIIGACVSGSFAIVFGPYFAILARDAWHNNEAEINLLWAAGSFASLIGIGLGRLSDRWGARRVLMLSAIGFAVGTIAWGISPSWETGLIPLLIAFVFSEGMFIAQMALQAEITKPETRSSVIGIITTTTGLIGGLGPTLGAWLITLGGNPMAFVAAGAMGLLAIGATLPIRKNKMGDSPESP